MEQLRNRQMVFSAVTVNNRLSSLKPVNSSSTEASRISSKPLDAQESVSGQVPCFLSLGCSPAAPRWGNPPSSWFTWREGVTLSPSRSHRAFLERGRKEAYHCRSGKLPGFTSTTQKALASQISGVAQGRAVGVFLVSTQAHKGMQTSHFALVLANSTRPTLVCIRGFLVR